MSDRKLIITRLVNKYANSELNSNVTNTRRKNTYFNNIIVVVIAFTGVLSIRISLNYDQVWPMSVDILVLHTFLDKLTSNGMTGVKHRIVFCSIVSLF